MKELDRSMPMEAVHKKTGAIGHVETVEHSKALTVGRGLDQYQTYFDKHGQPKDDFCPWVVRNVEVAATVDWSKPIEAVHTDGRVRSMKVERIDHNTVQTQHLELEPGVTNAFWHLDGSHCWIESGWRIRNVQSYTDAVSQLAEEAELRRNGFDTDNWRRAADTIPIDRALWERVDGLARGMASDMEADCDYATRHSYRRYQEARAIVGLLPAVATTPEQKVAAIIKNWRDGNAGEDDVNDTARLIVEALK